MNNLAVMLPALLPPENALTPAERRRALLERDDDAIARELVVFSEALREAALPVRSQMSARLGLPEAEIFASPFGLRACAMGIQEGVTTAHVEVRTWLDWPEEYAPADGVVDLRHGQWEDGRLYVGKYQGFLQDDVLCTYNPSHSAKWAPHEVLHRVIGCAYRPDMSRWELYLTSRLNELLPVTFWYGIDQVLRLDEGGFDRAAMAAKPAARMGDVKWLTEDASALLRRARATVRWLKDGLRRFDEELAAIRREAAAGVRIPVENSLLDSSSDATAYVVGHWPRLSSAAMAAVLSKDSTVLRSVAALRAQVEHVLDRLLFAPLALSWEWWRRAASSRILRDWLRRLALFGDEALDVVGPLAHDAVAPLDLARAGVEVDLGEWQQRFHAAVGSRIARQVLASGVVHPIAAPLDCAALVESVRAVAPGLLRYWEIQGRSEPMVRTFAYSPWLFDRAPLIERLSSFMNDRTSSATEVVLLGFEAALLALRTRDDQVEHLVTPASELSFEPENFAMGIIVRHKGFELIRLPVDIVPFHEALMAGDKTLPQSGPACCYLAGFISDSVSVVPCPPPVQLLWERLAQGPIPAAEAVGILTQALQVAAPEATLDLDAWGWLQELCTSGALGWVPVVDVEGVFKERAQKTSS